MTAAQAIAWVRMLHIMFVAAASALFGLMVLPSLIYPETPGRAVDCMRLPETKIRGAEVRV